MTWLETPSEHFVARHDSRDEADARQVLLTLETARSRLASLFGPAPAELAVVLHGSTAQLDAAAPGLPLQRRLTAPAGRRYLAGWVAEAELHVLAPRVLAGRASNVEGSLETLMLIPVALLAKRIVAEGNPLLPPPWGARSTLRYLRWAWSIEGAAQWSSGQVEHARPAIGRRLREGPAPAFPPSRADAPLLAGTLYDLLAREEGERACADLALADLRGGAPAALEAAFGGRPLRHTEAAWRAHLERVAAGQVRSTARPPGPAAR